MEKAGVIYILTNPSFPEYVKIGYADDVEKRLAQLNRSECIPFAFRIYATYEVNSRLSDLKIHEIIDKLNPNLRSIDNFEGKKRVREFYAMTKEDAYFLLEAIAEIHGCKDKLKRIQPTKEEQVDEEIAERIETETGIRRGNQPISKEEYLSTKKSDIVSLYHLIEKRLHSEITNIEEYVLPQYIGLKKNGKYFAEFHLQQNKIQIMTLLPDGKYSLGSRVPENFLWTLKYRVYVSNEKEIDELIEIIKESYNKR